MADWLDPDTPPYDQIEELHADWLDAADGKGFLEERYTHLARQLLHELKGHPSPSGPPAAKDTPAEITVELGPGSDSWHCYESGEIKLGTATLGDLKAGSIEWLGALHSHFIHEVAHELYSTHELPNGKPPIQAAAALLEDLRVERRLIGDSPAQRRWLRLNLARAWPDTSTVAARAQELDWPTVLTITAGRHPAGVVSSKEAERLLSNLPAQAQDAADSAREAWLGFCSLDDDAVADTHGERFVAALADRLSAQAVKAACPP